MPKISYVEKRFAGKSLRTIEHANAIIEDYQSQGFTLTLRQLYYQFVSRDLIENKLSEYKRLGAIISDARLAGLIDWESIEDRTRNLQVYSSWSGARHCMIDAGRGMQVDIWGDQENYVEVWIEKDALIGVIEDVCDRYRVPYFACKGYNSQSEQWNAGMRLQEKIDEGKQVHILHLGDHDPSGIHMTTDNQERLTMFSGHDITLHRLALNMDQVRKYNPPPNPAKETDSRFKIYMKKFGKSCWELDALEPKVINGAVERRVQELIDHLTWQESLEREQKAKDKILKLAEKA